MVELLIAFVFAASLWFWLDSMRSRENAVAAAKHACAADGVQLLDDTVALATVGLMRDDEGRIALRRIYQFEFSDSGDNRLKGSVALLGKRVRALHLAAHAAPPRIIPIRPA